MSLKTVLIQDARIADMTDEEHFAVLDGASQSTFQNFAASTQSSSSIVWNVQIPSENVVIDRHTDAIYSNININISWTYRYRNK